MSSPIRPDRVGHPERADSVTEAAREGYAAPRSALDADDGRSIGAVLADITANISTLLRQEVALAKAELRQSGSQAARASAYSPVPLWLVCCCSCSSRSAPGGAWGSTSRTSGQR